MEKFQSPRQNKINSALQKEIAYLLQGIIRKENISNLMISVTKINVSPDLSSAKVYLSIFPNDNILDYLNSLNEEQRKAKEQQKIKEEAEARIASLAYGTKVKNMKQPVNSASESINTFDSNESSSAQQSTVSSDGSNHENKTAKIYMRHSFFVRSTKFWVIPPIWIQVL